MATLLLRSLSSLYSQSADPETAHRLEDAAPYTWCCLQARSTPDEDYAQMYLDRRPAASSHLYDRFGFGNFKERNSKLWKLTYISHLSVHVVHECYYI